jgi:hypothetical protein
MIRFDFTGPSVQVGFNTENVQLHHGTVKGREVGGGAMFALQPIELKTFGHSARWLASSHHGDLRDRRS